MKERPRVETADRVAAPFSWVAIVLLAGASALNGCGPPGPAPRGDADDGPQEVLKVALYPWIPDAADDGFESLRARLEAEFESRHPGVDLRLRLDEIDDGFYDVPKLAAWLAAGTYDLVEIDTVLLGDLVETGVLEPWEERDPARFFPAAVQASTLAGPADEPVWWGVPHYLCGFFIVSRAPAIDAATSIDELMLAVGRSGKPVLGNFDSSWDLPSLYLDARVDNGLDPAGIADGVDPPLDAASVAALERFAGLCEVNGRNPCLDGAFRDDPAAPVDAFVRGEATAFWGFSERLHLAVRGLRREGRTTDDLLVNTIPLGNRAISLLFTDAFVKRAGCSRDLSCAASTDAFVEFINDEWALEELFLSGDADAAGVDSAPRYLLPAARAAYELPGFESDRLYRELRPFVENGSALPNDAELYEKRFLLTRLIETALSN